MSHRETQGEVRYRRNSPSRGASPPTRPETAVAGSIADAGLVGAFFTPHGAGPWPTVIVLSGSAGGAPDNVARRLGRCGVAALALAYFGAPSLPRTLVEVPLEYVQRAARWLCEQERVNGEVIGLVGGSKGAELALLSAARFPELIGPVVASAPSSVVWHGLELIPGVAAATTPSHRSSWTWQGAPVAFIPGSDVAPLQTGRGLRVDRCYATRLEDAEVVARAAIPVEQSSGPLLLLSGQDDHVWPSARMADMLVARLAGHGRAAAIDHTSYAGAGHALLSPPANPTSSPAAGLDMGGNPDADTRARTDAWDRIPAFLARALAARGE